MEKLIELLNEYDKINEVNNKWFINDYGRLDREYNWATATSSCRKAISKDYGFIKRLLDNNKIRYEKVREQVEKEPMSIGRGLKYNILLMLLAISENPIEDLISYLK